MPSFLEIFPLVQGRFLKFFFTIHGHGSHLGHVTSINFGHVVFEKSKLEFSYVNDLDFEYSNTFINLISCLHLQTFRSQSAIVSEKFTVFTFSCRNAKIIKFDLAVK